MISEILNSYSLCLNDTRQLIADLNAAQMVAQPSKPMNHPAWIIGHLIYSAQMIGGELAVPPWLSDQWVALFRTGSVPKSDPALYPTKTELLESLTDAQNRLAQRLSAMNDTDLAQPLPDKRYRDIYPSLGHAILHILTVHTSYHVGQISAWRRAMGFPPVVRLQGNR